MGNKVIFLRSNPVAPDSRVEKEVNSLLKAGYLVSVLAWDRGSENGKQQSFLKLQNGKAKIIRFGIKASFGERMKNLRAFLLFQLCLARWLIKNRKQYDIVHACDFDTAFTANLVCMLTKKKLVFDIFDYLYTVPKNALEHIVKKLEDLIINRADAVIICSEKRKRQIAGTKPKKLAVIHNSPAAYYIPAGKELKNRHQKKEEGREQLHEEKLQTEDLHTEKLQIEELYAGDKTKVAYVGILQEGRLLKELASVIAKTKGVELHVGGFGKLEEYFGKMAEHYENIRFYGKLSYEETIKLESNCDVITAIYDPKMENHRYAAPNKFYEGLMLGKPLIMVKGTGMSAVVEKYGIGELISYGTEGFREGLFTLIQRKGEWEKLGVLMQRLYWEMYSWEQMENRLLQLYEELVKIQ